MLAGMLAAIPRAHWCDWSTKDQMAWQCHALLLFGSC